MVPGVPIEISAQISQAPCEKNQAFFNVIFKSVAKVKTKWRFMQIGIACEKCWKMEYSKHLQFSSTILSFFSTALTITE